MCRCETRPARNRSDIRFPSCAECTDDRDESAKASGYHAARETPSRPACIGAHAASVRGSPERAIGGGHWAMSGSCQCDERPPERFQAATAYVPESGAGSPAFRAPASPRRRAGPARPWNAPSGSSVSRPANAVRHNRNHPPHPIAQCLRRRGHSWPELCKRNARRIYWPHFRRPDPLAKAPGPWPACSGNTFPSSSFRLLAPNDRP